MQKNPIIHIMIRRMYENRNYGPAGSSIGAKPSKRAYGCTLWSIERTHKQVSKGFRNSKAFLMLEHPWKFMAERTGTRWYTASICGHRCMQTPVRTMERDREGCHLFLKHWQTYLRVRRRNLEPGLLPLYRFRFSLAIILLQLPWFDYTLQTGETQGRANCLQVECRQGSAALDFVLPGQGLLWSAESPRLVSH